MKLKLNKLNVISFLAGLILFIRQLYYFNLISSFVVSDGTISGLIILLAVILAIMLVVAILYYLPVLAVLNITFFVEFKTLELPVNKTSYHVRHVHVLNKQNIYQRLQVVRC